MCSRERNIPIMTNLRASPQRSREASPPSSEKLPSQSHEEENWTEMDVMTTNAAQKKGTYDYLKEL
jgi:hypothetical protein